MADVEVHRQWNDPTVPAGYLPATLRFAVPGRPYGEDLMSEFSEAAARASAVACPTVEQAPPSGGSSATAGPGDVYVYDGGDGDGESRFCSRRRWC